MKFWLIGIALLMLVSFQSGVLVWRGNTPSETLLQPITTPKPVSTYIPTYVPPAISLNSSKLWALVQNWRIKQGFSAYIENDTLCQLASKRLTQVKKDWSHDQFLPTGAQFVDYNKYRIGENLAKEYFTESQLLTSWLKSPSHRFNLDDSFTHSCIKTEGTYAVQIFGNLWRPLSYLWGVELDCFSFWW